MTTRVEIDQVEFANGKPRYPYDEIYRCFHGDHNGLLFRCVDNSAEKKKWHFYNDTTDTVMKVRTTFKAGSKIEPLRGAKVTTINNPETGEDETVVEIEVLPTMTQQFMEGVPNGFEMEFQTEAAPSEDVEFENGNPRKRYDKIYKCFRNSGNGLLFRLVDERSHTWYFHNDTQDYDMVATVEFSDRSAIEVLGNTQEVGTPEGNPDGVILSLTIPPCSTEPFITGTPSNYRMSYSADPVNNDKPEDIADLQFNNEPGPDGDVINLDGAHFYRCFKKDGNGLLFRIVDEANKVWAYYNDTEHYIMTATVKFPQSENFHPSSHAEAHEDPEDPNVTVVVMEIPPLTTLKFIDGAPKNFETSYTAESVNRSKPEENPNFRNGEPDRSIMEYDEVTRVVKAQDSDDAVLYRLFDSSKRKWGFFNDTNDVTVMARVKFNDGARIQKFGKTRVDSDDSGNANGIYYVVEIAPLETVEFIQGDYTTFESKFSGSRKVPSQGEN